MLEFKEKRGFAGKISRRDIQALTRSTKVQVNGK
jgi:hypothetical protein